MDRYFDHVATPAEVLEFWCGAFPLRSAAMARVRERWFKKDDAFDRALRLRFGVTLLEALAGKLDTWAGNDDGWLALIIVLDQFTRNAFRGQPTSFAGDVQARALALKGIQQRRDQKLPAPARVFCYLPFEHAEVLEMQDRAVELIEALQPDADDAWSEHLAASADYARRHRDVMREYGRFPHRNAILGRANTPEEEKYLAQPGAGF